MCHLLHERLLKQRASSDPADILGGLLIFGPNQMLPFSAPCAYGHVAETRGMLYLVHNHLIPGVPIIGNTAGNCSQGWGGGIKHSAPMWRQEVASRLSERQPISTVHSNFCYQQEQWACPGKVGDTVSVPNIVRKFPYWNLNCPNYFHLDSLLL